MSDPEYIGNYPLEKLTLNDWNPNEMDSEMMIKLKKSIVKIKFIVPIVANLQGIIINGAHRYMAVLELNKEGHNIKTVPVYLVDMTEDEMKMSTIGLNNIRGYDSPIKLAKLLQDLNERYSLAEISEQGGYNSDTLKDKLELLKMPEDIIQKLKESAELQEKEVPIVIHFQLSREQEKVVSEALERVGGKDKSERLYNLCSAYLTKEKE